MSKPRPSMATMAMSTPSALVPLMAPAIYREVAFIAGASLSDNDSCRQKSKGIGIIVDEANGARGSGTRMCDRRARECMCQRVSVRLREAVHGGEESERSGA